jgi:hypothetical protein
MPPLRPPARPAASAARPAPAARPATAPAPRAAVPAARPAAPARALTPRAPLRGSSQPFEFEYEEIDSETASKHANASTGNYDSYIDRQFQMYKVRDGQNSLRILPCTFDWKGLGIDNHWAFPVSVHYGIGPDEAAYLCPHEMKGEDCSLCNERRTLAADDPEAAKALKASKRWLVWVLDRLNPTEGPRIWAMPSTVEKSLNVLSKTAKGIVQLSHPVNGYDISFIAEGKAVQRKYNALQIDRDPSPLSDDAAKAQEWYNFVKANPLSQVLQWYEDSYVAEVRSGQVERAPEGEEPTADEAPARTTRRSVRAAAAEPEPEPEETVEEETTDEAGVEPPTPEEIMAMGEDELFALIDTWQIEINTEDYSTVEDLASALCDVFASMHEAEEAADAVDEPAEEEPEPEPEPAPAPRRLGIKAAPAAKAPAARPAAKPAAAPARTAPAKPTAPAAGMSPADRAKARLAGMRK